MTDAIDVIDFWLDAGPERWFSHDELFDQDFHQRFEAAHLDAARRGLEDWLGDANGALALVILLDQFPRNCFRKTAHAYATDPLARHYATRAIASGFDEQVHPQLRAFFYMPFMHSEDLADQDRTVELMQPLGPELLQHALDHRETIRSFGRFPHRNHELARHSTPEEQAYLDAGGGFVTKKKV